MAAATTAKVSVGTGARKGRSLPKVATIDSLRAAHPEALRDLYARGEVADPASMKLSAGLADGAFLTFEPLRGAYLFTRPAVAMLSRYMVGWRGKVFERGGTAGANLIFGRKLFRFHCEVEASRLDGNPTLTLRYDNLGNRWPVKNIVDELRRVGDHVCIGPASLELDGKQHLLFWWGLQA